MPTLNLTKLECFKKRDPIGKHEIDLGTQYVYQDERHNSTDTAPFTANNGGCAEVASLLRPASIRVLAEALGRSALRHAFPRGGIYRAASRTLSAPALGSAIPLPAVAEPISRMAYDGVPETRPRKLTTAESLVVEVVVAHHALGKPYTVLAGEHWVTPQLEALEHLGFVAWSFDVEGNFRIEPRPLIFAIRPRFSH